FNIRLLALKELSQNGRNISSFEKSIIKLLSEWVSETVQIMDQQTTLQTKTPISSSKTEDSTTTTSEVHTTKGIGRGKWMMCFCKINTPHFQIKCYGHIRGY